MLQQELNKIWGTWEIDRPLGEGAFGKVYRIEKKGSKGYEAALKVIRIPQNESEIESVLNDGMDEDSVVQYFRSIVDDIKREFDLMYRLKGNTNIVSYEDHEVVPNEGKIGWTIYIRMELLTPLFEYMKRKPLAIRDVIRLGIDICNALEICQTYNIIHRDIKPENIFVSELGNFKLGDFGIARQLEKTSAGLSKKGTYSYMAPEVYKGEEYNSTVDIYSLGIVLYRFLNNNRTPFLPAYPKPILYTDRERANMLRISGTPLPKPCMAEGRLAEIILKACSYDPKDRYESAADMKRALESILYEESLSNVAYPNGDKLGNQSFEYTNSVVNQKVMDDEDVEGTQKLETDFILQSLNDYTEKKSEEIKKVEEVKKVEETKQQNYDNIPNKTKKEPKNKKGLIIAIVAVILIAAAVFGVKAHKKSLERIVPDFTNMTIEEAASATDIAVNVAGEEYSDTVDKGDIISQSIEPETVITKKDTVDVIVSKGALIEVPSVKGKSQKKAEEILTNAGFVFEVSDEKYSDDVEKGHVISQSVKKGTKLEEGEKITVVISKGVEKVKVPDVVGKSESEAKKALEDAKLKYDTSSDYSSSVGEGKVISQSIDAGDKVEKNTEVKIVISLGPKPAPKPVYKPSKNNSSEDSDSDLDYGEWYTVN